MSKFFSLKLYLQGLKKSRLQGIAIAGIVTVLTALVPLTNLLTPRYYEPGIKPPTTIIGYEEFAIPLILLLFLTPILTLSMFGFLNKRNESDFYHAIPFTRPCVYFSFLAAVMTWLVATLILAIGATTVLWWIAPYTAVSFATPFVYLLVYFLATLLLTAFTIVAMTLTGTPISNLLIFALLFSFVRITGALFVACIDSQFPVIVIDLTIARFLQIDYSLPLALVGPFLFGNPGSAFSNYGLWLYTAIISVALIAVGCVLYTRRRSEMAGKSAPNRILQHIYRCMITMPMVFVIAYYIIEEGFEPEMLLVLIVIALLIYYVYELITTKRLKNLLTATLFLPVLLVGGIAFGVGVAITGNVAINYTPDADEIKSVSFYNSYYYDEPSYEKLNTQTVSFDHPEVLKFVAKELKEMKETIQESDANHYLHPERYLDEYYYNKDVYYSGAIEEQENSYNLWTIKITDKSGKVCGRTLCLTATEYETLSALFTQTEEYESALLALPTESEILYIDANIYYENESALDAVWESFVKEFNALSREEKITYKSIVTNDEWYQHSLYVRGMKGVDRFYSTYPLYPALFPETCKQYTALANENEKTMYTEAVNAVGKVDSYYFYFYVDTNTGSYSLDNQSKLISEAVEFLEGCKESTDPSAQIICVSLNAENANEYFGGMKYYILSEEDIVKLFGIMQIDGYVEKGEFE